MEKDFVISGGMTWFYVLWLNGPKKGTEECDLLFCNPTYLIQICDLLGTQYGPVLKIVYSDAVSGWAGGAGGALGALAHPIFGSSVNPIPTRG